MIASIAKHEAGSLLRSPVTWLLAGVLALIFAYLFLQALETFLDIQPQLAAQDNPTGLSGFLSARYLSAIVAVLAIMAPLLGMRSFSDTYRNDSMPLWQSAPITSTQLALGKYAGVLLVVLMIIAIAIAMPSIMRLFTPLDLGVLGAAALGLTLAAMAFTAIGVFFSSLTKHSLLAVAGSILLLLLLWLIGSVSSGTDSSLSALTHFSIPNHLGGFFQGYINTANIVYFITLTLLFVALTILRLDALRHTGR